jgi:hypothetical protein
MPGGLTFGPFSPIFKHPFFDKQCFLNTKQRGGRSGMFTLTTVIVLTIGSFVAGLLAAISFSGFRARHRFRADLARLIQRSEQLRARIWKGDTDAQSSGIHRWMTHHVQHSLDQGQKLLATADNIWSVSRFSGRGVLHDAELIMAETEAVMDCLSRYLPSILALQRRCADDLHEEILLVHGQLSMKASNGAFSCDLNDERRELSIVGEALSRCQKTSADDLEGFLRQLRQHLRRMNCLAKDIDRKIGLRDRSLR